jgi:hypothetical protein
MLIEDYYNELKEDVHYDQLNILEKQLMLPAIKHKWVSRLINQKRQKLTLEKKKKELKESVLNKMMADGSIPTGVPKASIQAKLEASDTVRKIDDELKELDLVIEYLEKVEKILSSITYDIGNATKLMVLETT